MIRPTFVAQTLVCFTALLLTSRLASAKPKVALTQIDGDASGDVHDAVAEALEGKELSLIGSREVNRAVDKLGDPADFTEKELKKLATTLEADAIVLGKLEKSGGTKSLKFRLFVHKKMAKGFTVNFKDSKSEKFHALLHDKILDKIGVAPAGDDDDAVATKGAKGKAAKGKAAKPAKGDDDDDAKPTKAAKGDDDDVKPKKGKAAKDDDDDAKPTKAAKGDDDDAKPKKAAKPAKGDDDDAKPTKTAKGDDDDAKPAKGDKDDDGDRKPRRKVATSDDGGDDLTASVSASAGPAAGAHSSSTPGVRVDAGLSVLAHTYKFNVTPTATAGPHSASLSPTPGARLDGELYPFALGGSGGGAASNFGFGFDLDRTLTLKLTAAANGVTQSTTVKQMNYSFGVRYRLAFGASDMAPSVTLNLGYGKRLFSPDKTMITDPTIKSNITRDTPTTQYTLIDPGATLRLPVAKMFALVAGARGMVITNGGPIQASTSYGQAKVYGVEAMGGLDVLVTPRIVLSFTGNFDQIGFTFQGKGTLSKDADGNQIVGGLADRGLGGAATLGVLY